MARRSRTTTHRAGAPSSVRPATPALPPASRRTAAAIVLALVALTVVAYTPVWRFDFVAVDDPQYVYDNPHIADGLTLRSVAWAFTTGREANWHPLTWISHAADVQWFGLRAGAHHAVNLAWHLVSTMLLFGVLRRMTGSTWRSAFVAAVFALHPLHVESVAWVAERKDVLSAFFFMLTLGAYVRYAAAPGAGRYGLVALCLALGLMAKPMLVTMPMLFLLLDYWPLGRVIGGPGALRRPSPLTPGRSWTALAIEKAPLLAIVVASGIVTFLVQRGGGAVKDLAALPVGWRVQNAVVSYVDYLIDVVWPAALGVFYPIPTTIPPARVAIAALVLAAATASAVAFVRRAPFVAVGWFWFLGMLVPVSGLAQVGGQARADRFMYLPLIGLSIAIAWGACALARTRAGQRVLAAAGVAAVLACAVVTRAQVQHWRNTESLWSHTARVTDGMNNFGVYFSLGEYLMAQGRPADAVGWYEQSIARNPAYFESRLSLGRAHLALDQPDRAAPALVEAVRLRPDSHDARLALGVVLADIGRGPDAVPHLTEAIRLRPDVALSHWRLALALASSGRVAEALPVFADAARLAPDSAPIRNDFGWALVQHGRVADGLAQLREAIRLKPDLADAHHNAGRVLASLGNTADAIAHLTEAVRLDAGFLDARLSLGLTLAGAGRTDEAARELREVLRLAPGHPTAVKALQAIGR